MTNVPNHLIFITFDSCRFDTFAAAPTPNLDRIARAEKRYTYASWTVPAHAVFLIGATPHSSPPGVFASEVYKDDFARWGERLNIPGISFKGFVPRLSLPAFLRAQGYETHARVSMPVLNQTTVLNQHFDSYKLMNAHNDFRPIIEELHFTSGRPQFYFLNLGETHYPYTLPGESGADLPRISGVHGVFKHLDDLLATEAHPEQAPEERFFNMDQMVKLKAKQQSNVAYLDTLFPSVFDRVPPNTYFMIMSDHGECFGEAGYFGHGPVFHEKVFEVFYLEGKRP